MSWVYILVMTLVAPSGVAITSILGFTSEQACQQAAVTWAKETKKHLGSATTLSAVCLYRGNTLTT